MNTTIKFIVLAAVAASMIGATIAADISPAFADRNNKCKSDCTSGQQNSGDTIANGGNFVGGDLNVGNEP